MLDRNGTTLAEGEVIDEAWTLVMVGVSYCQNSVLVRNFNAVGWAVNLKKRTDTQLEMQIFTRFSRGETLTESSIENINETNMVCKSLSIWALQPHMSM